MGYLSVLPGLLLGWEALSSYLSVFTFGQIHPVLSALGLLSLTDSALYMPELHKQPVPL